MKKKTFLGLIIIAIILIFAIYRYNSTKIKTITYNELNDCTRSNEYTVVYVGVVSKDIKKKLKSLYKTYLLKPYILNSDLEILNVYLNELKLNANSLPVYILYDKTGLLGVVDGNLDETHFVEQIKKNLYGDIPQDEIKYKVATVEQYKKLINKNEYTIAVISEESCSYCKLLQKVINDISTDKDIDIYYFKKDNMSEDDYNELLKIDFKIPAKCTTTGTDTTLQKGFPKPLTLITKNGKLVDCIKGYYPYTEYYEQLQNIGVVE